MSAALGLEPLLTALRETGLPVGVSEVARLQQVFTLGPQIAAPEDRRLKAVLRAVLVKSAEDRARFEPIFDAWLGRAGQEVSLHEAQIIPSLPELARPPKKSFWPRAAIVALAIALLVPLGLAISRRQPKAQPEPIPISTTPNPTPVEPTPPPPTQAIFWVPTLTVTPGQPLWRGWPALTLGCLALLSAGALWLTLRQRSWLPEPAPEPIKKGPPRVFLTPPELAGPQFLELREQEALVWGIGHFVADEPTHRLDLPATVRATARNGGIPHLLFHRARYPREVWLWIDEAADDPAIPRLADEIEEALKTHTLPVERALFRGIPDWLVGSSGHAFAPNEVDERRDASLVAILTDGRVLSRQYAADDHRVKLDALLRSLSHWPRLAFVDFAAEPGDLTAILGKHSLLRIAPQELATFLGREKTAKRKISPAVTGDAIWAAACALAPASVDEMRAFHLRKHLKLKTSPWALRKMRAEAPGPPGRLQWPPQVRAQRVNWLREAEAQPTGQVAAGSYLDKALEFWRDAYDEELTKRNAEAKEGAWLKTPAYQHLAMERALLGLWRDAPNAVRELYRLHGGALRRLIEQHLSQLAPLDRGGSEHLHLPWRWQERSGAEQVMLQTMRLGGDLPAATLRRPGRLFLGIGLCLGLASGALTAAALSRRRPPEGPPSVVHGPRKPADAFQNVKKISDGRWRVTVATTKAQAAQEAPAGSIVKVRWEEMSLPCRNGELLEKDGMTFVHVCSGTFIMGSAAQDRLAYDNERPAHEVTLSEFWIGRTEVTNAQYRGEAAARSGQGNLPAAGVSWFEAKDFCERHGWRLPTEAEWEYAARAGTQTRWSLGDERQLGEFAWFIGNSSLKPHPVGTKKPNPWGLYDMHGNVWEWVADWYSSYKPDPQRDPRGPDTGEYRTVRGGSFINPPGNLRFAVRYRYQPSFRNWTFGFRCARSPRRQP